MLDGVYPPNLQKQARQAHEKILTCGRRGELFQYHPSAGAGTVCALLSLLAQNRIEPQIEFGDVVLQQTVRHTTMDEPPLTLMFELLELDDRGQDGGDVDMNDETSDDVKATLLERVQQSGRTGMALTTLIEEAEDKQIVVKAANMLLAAGDLRMVGQLQHRFVASTFESDWYRPRVVRTVVEESSTAAVTKVADAASGFAVARPWISATGTFMPVVFQKLANAVLLALVNKPITSMV